MKKLGILCHVIFIRFLADFINLVRASKKVCARAELLKSRPRPALTIAFLYLSLILCPGLRDQARAHSITSGLYYKITTSHLRRRTGLCRSPWSSFIGAYIALYDGVNTTS